MSAIRARLARKSLPLVSADGLVIYGLQISPTVQVATGILFYILLMNSFYFINSILKKFANNYNYNYIKYLEKNRLLLFILLLLLFIKNFVRSNIFSI